ncbi:hypothetical protein SRHO_G00192520 [Serrasalmus rhombeus]
MTEFYLYSSAKPLRYRQASCAFTHWRHARSSTRSGWRVCARWIASHPFWIRPSPLRVVRLYVFGSRVVVEKLKLSAWSPGRTDSAQVARVEVRRDETQYTRA